MSAYYNEFDPQAAAWLRELIKQGHLPDGEVDERDMREVDPDDIRGFDQWHFFAGIGGWPYALRLAGWPDDRPVLTGSPPCQPFSTAGRQRGVEDERHLAPHFLELVAALRPPVVFGEQVASAVKKDNWLDDLLDALENTGYATGAAVIPACGLGSPHIRQRLWFTAVRMGNADHQGSQGRVRVSDRADQQPAGPGGVVGGVANAVPTGRPARRAEPGDGQIAGERCAGRHGSTPTPAPGWDDPDWLYCRDGKWRPVEPGTCPLASRVPARMGRLRGYGNAIVPQVAVEVIREVVGKADES